MRRGQQSRIEERDVLNKVATEQSNRVQQHPRKGAATDHSNRLQQQTAQRKNAATVHINRIQQQPAGSIQGKSSASLIQSSKVADGGDQQGYYHPANSQNNKKQHRQY